MRQHGFWFSADRPANPVARFFKKAECDSPSPEGEGRGEDGRKKTAASLGGSEARAGAFKSGRDDGAGGGGDVLGDGGEPGKGDFCFKLCPNFFFPLGQPLLKSAHEVQQIRLGNLPRLGARQESSTPIF